jgi:hypothetical protein
MHRNNMLKICHTFEVVGGPDTSDHLCSRRHIPHPPGEVEDESRGGAELSKGRVAVRVIGRKQSSSWASGPEFRTLAMAGMPLRVRAARAGEEW